jgi:hypothetical protein
MPTRIGKRPMTQNEREFLSRTLKDFPTSSTRLRRAIENAVITWAVLMLLYVFAWKGVAWVVHLTLHTEIGWKSSANIWLIAAGALLCATYSVFSTVRWLKRWPDPRAALLADLEDGEVAEEHYEFTAAKRFQEPEHGGLIYFLRTTDDKVFVLFDHESQDLGARGEDPLASEFRPCQRLELVRAPHSELVVAQTPSGAPLEVGPQIELTVGPSKWPESESYCEGKWDELEKRFGKARKVR